MLIIIRRLIALTLLCSCGALQAQETKSFDAGDAFGARQSITGLSLSPDGGSVAYITPAEGQGGKVYTLSLAKGALRKLALSVNGKPLRLESCEWVANDRLVCTVYGVVKSPNYGLLNMSRVVAINADGTNFRVLSTRENVYSYGLQLGGGEVLDWLPDEDGAVLMTRMYLPDDHIGSHIGSRKSGLGVDRIDTRTLTVRQVEPPRPDAAKYITDGRGTVRIMGITMMRSDGMDSGVITYSYREQGSRDWHRLGAYNRLEKTGFEPVAVDHDRNIAYGFQEKDGRLALYSVALDDSLRAELVYARPDVDVDGLVRIGRRQHMVGASYTTDTRQVAYFSSDIEKLMGSLAKALPQQPLLRVAGSSVDEQRLLIFAGSDADPGAYYIFDRAAHQLQTFLVARDQLEGVKLATVRSISYPAADGVPIPAYLTLPPGHETAKGLPAIVLPHGGPSARDTWGFDWLAQFYASRGFAVLQPNFRGSSGYGDAWLEKNGFRSWPVAIGDVLAGGRWLVSEGIADPSKLAIVGWSYGGYAALQAAIVDPTLFKAVIAIAPVTDLHALKEQSRHFTDFNVVSEFIGEGSQMHAGSPVEHADKIKVPVLLFHAMLDTNVGVDESRLMAARLTAAGGKCELVTWDELDHYLDDSNARAQMLHKSDTFLRQALGM